jgi:hypothetical protein
VAISLWVRRMSMQLIKSILSEPSIAEALSADGREIPESGTYLLHRNCLFPCVLNNGVLDMHAAILPELRGKVAIDAGREAIAWGRRRGYKVVCKVKSNIKKDGVFAALCGMERVSSDGDYNYYEAK